MKKIFTMMLAVFLLTGCASAIKKDIEQQEYNLSQSNKIIEDNKRWLSSSKAYVGGRCVEPKLLPRPRFACESSDQASQTALAICAIKYKGCDAAASLFGGKLQSAQKKFLTSQACEIKLAELLGETRTVTDLGIDALQAYSDHSCENGGSCLASVAFGSFKFLQFVQCLGSVGNACAREYESWRMAPLREKRMCETVVSSIANERANIASAKRKIDESKSSFVWKVFGD